MGWAGAGAGAAAGLEQVLERRLKEAIRQQQAQQHNDQLMMQREQMGMQREQMAGVNADREANRQNQLQTIDLAKLKHIDAQRQAATEAAGRSDMAGVLAMPGMSNADKANEIMGSGVRTGSVDPLKLIEGLTKVAPRTPLHSVTVPGPDGRPMARGVTDEELQAGVATYREPKTPTKADRDPIADYEARLKLDRQYKQPGAGGIDPAAEAQDTAREAKRIADALAAHPGLRGAFGVVDARLPTMRQSTADAEVLRDSLTSLLTMENMGKMKGVLSDSDMKILRQASSTIAAPMSDAAARAELKRLSEVMGRASGDGGLPAMDMATSRDGAAPVKPKFTIIKKQ
jgi:hypothetical protein